MRHDGTLARSGITGALHLFTLRSAGSSDFISPGPDSLPSDLWSPIPDRDTLLARLEAVAGVLPPVHLKAATELEGQIDLSDLARGSTIDRQQIAHGLAAAYLLGDKGRLVIPFIKGAS